MNHNQTPLLSAAVSGYPGRQDHHHHHHRWWSWSSWDAPATDEDDHPLQPASSTMDHHHRCKCEAPSLQMDEPEKEGNDEDENDEKVRVHGQEFTLTTTTTTTSSISQFNCRCDRCDADGQWKKVESCWIDVSQQIREKAKEAPASQSVSLYTHSSVDHTLQHTHTHFRLQISKSS